MWCTISKNWYINSAIKQTNKQTNNPQAIPVLGYLFQNPLNYTPEREDHHHTEADFSFPQRVQYNVIHQNGGVRNAGSGRICLFLPFLLT